MPNRRRISEDATRRLWVRAGGRCEYHGCNEYLLEDELTTFTLNLAERAHIVGASKAPRSPRGGGRLPVHKRDGVDNLMLLCRRHHRMIDRLVADHAIDELRWMKRNHEERIRLVTGLHEATATVVVRAIGGIRGAAVEVPRDAVLTAVRADGRFPRFPLAIAGDDIEIDLRNLPHEGDQDYWATGERIIAVQAARIRDAQHAINHVSVFALARIPLLVALGFHIDDKVPTTIYQRRRDGTGDLGWGFDPDAEAVSFAGHRIAVGGPRVALAVSLTAPIGADVVSVVGADATVYEIGPEGTPPSRDVLTARASLDAFAQTYHSLLTTLEAEHPRLPEIELFAAVPASGAVQLGRGVMRDAQPALVVHDRDANGAFQPALRLGR